MRRRVHFRQPATETLPSEELPPHPTSSSIFSNEKFSGAPVEGVQAFPWPGTLQPAALGQTAPYDEDFAQRVAAPGPDIGWQQWEQHSRPLWGRKDVILAEKQLEYELFAETAQSRRHELALFQHARVRAPPQNLNQMPDVANY